MSRIHVLSDLLVNKIAAGEVIERPASVAKELLENSIDAGATRVDVVVEDGGKKLIRISDDGCGMGADDLALAVTPHATSKLATEDDLFRIGTMGFRGEALASIGSVSHLRLVSRLPEEASGHEIRMSGETIEGPAPTAASPGTTVEVRDLFFNVPARRKFLRTTNTEMGHLTEQLIRIGLANLHVHLTCKHNDRRVHDLPACGGQDRAQALRERIAGLFGPELAEALIAIDRRERGLHIAGWVAPPAQTRGTAAWQYTWLNGRFIKDRFVQHAIREAYRGLLPQGRFPVVFLFLETDPAEVDVNVHPTKIEVRFRDSNLVHSQVLAALRETFLRMNLAPDLTADTLERTSGGGSTRAFGSGSQSFGSGGGGTGGGFGGRMGGGGPRNDPAVEAQGEAMRQQLAEFLKGLPPSRTGGRPEAFDEAATSGGEADSSLGADRWADAASGESDATSGQGFAFRPLPALQIHNTYLVAESDDGLIIVDQHALHERIIYQQLVRRFAEGKLESQRLLLPETIDVTPAELACVEAHEGLFDKLGLDLQRFGPTIIAVQAVPSIFNDIDSADWVRQLLARLADQPDQDLSDEYIHELLEMMACKAAVKAGDPLTPDEVVSLLDQRTTIEKSSACPHGRPTTLRLSLRDLEKQFKRT